MERIKGLIPAVITPLNDHHEVDLTKIVPLVEHLIKDQVSAFYVCGSTGEGPLLTTEERKKVAEEIIKITSNRVPVIVQVGHNSLKDACDLASHAANIRANAISAVPPTYFKPDSLDTLITCMAEIAAAAPELPFYYYHIPQITGVDFDMVEFLQKGAERIPNLQGIKYSKFTIIHEVIDITECNGFV